MNINLFTPTWLCVIFLLWICITHIVLSRAATDLMDTVDILFALAVTLLLSVFCTLVGLLLYCTVKNVPAETSICVVGFLAVWLVARRAKMKRVSN